MFTATSLPGSAIPTAPFAVSDKLVHLMMYAVLGILVARASDGLRSAKGFLATLASLVVFGLVDELHQSLVPGRSTDIRDWAADALGALLGLVLGLFLFPSAPMRRTPP